MSLIVETHNVPPEVLAPTLRLANYMGIVAQINGSLIEQVRVEYPGRGPEFTAANGTVLTLGVGHLPSLETLSPPAVATWCGVSLHGFAHSRYSPRPDEPLRERIARFGMSHQRMWNAVEDARIERLLLREFPGWTPYLLAVANELLIKPATPGGSAKFADLHLLVCGRTFLPQELRAEIKAAFAAEHGDLVADRVEQLVKQYSALIDPGTDDVDTAVQIVVSLCELLGMPSFNTCGSHNSVTSDEGSRSWVDPGDPDDDDAGGEGVGGDGEGGDGEGAGGEGAGADGEGAGADGEGDGDGEGAGEGAGGEGADGDGEGADGEGEGAGADGDGDGEGEGAGADGEGAGGDGEGAGGGGEGEGADGDEPTSQLDDSNGHGVSTGKAPRAAWLQRAAQWRAAINEAVAQDERVIEALSAARTGPLPTINLRRYPVETCPVGEDAQLAQIEVARELRRLLDGARPGMRRRVDRGRFNLPRYVREGGATPVGEMFDRHDPGALRSTGMAVAVLVDVSSSMHKDQRIVGAMESLWAIEEAVRSVRGKFKSWAFGSEGYELDSPPRGVMIMPTVLDGSTRPAIALAAANAWLSQQREPNRLMIVATDGYWSGGQAYAELEACTMSGAQVAVFGIGMGSKEMSAWHGRAALVAAIKSAADLGPAVGQMLVNQVKSALRR